jgi:hypothetical protein
MEVAVKVLVVNVKAEATIKCGQAAFTAFMDLYIHESCFKK